MVVTTRRQQAHQQRPAGQKPPQATRKQRTTRANPPRQTQPRTASPSPKPSYAATASPKSGGRGTQDAALSPAKPSSHADADSPKSVGRAPTSCAGKGAATPTSVGGTETHDPLLSPAKPSPRRSYAEVAGTNIPKSPPNKSPAAAEEPSTYSSGTDAHESADALAAQREGFLPLKRKDSWRSFETLSSLDDDGDDDANTSLTSPTEDPTGTESSEPDPIAESTLAREMHLLDLDDGFRIDTSNMSDRNLYQPVSVFFPTTDSAGCRFGQINDTFVVAEVPVGCQLDVQQNDQIMAINGVDATRLSIEDFKAEWNRNRNGQRLVTLGRKIQLCAGQEVDGASRSGPVGRSGQAGRNGSAGRSGFASRGASHGGRSSRSGRTGGRAAEQRGRQGGRPVNARSGRGRARVTSRLDEEDNANALAAAVAAKEKSKFQRQPKATFARRFGDLRGRKAEQERLRVFQSVAEYGKMVTPDPSIEGAENWVKIVPALLLVDPFMPPNKKGGRRTYGLGQTREERVALLAFSEEHLDLAKSYMKALVDSNFGQDDEAESDFRIRIGTNPTTLWQFFRELDGDEDGPNGVEEEAQEEEEAAAAPEDDFFVSMFSTPAREN